jgi:hypothetical protein
MSLAWQQQLLLALARTFGHLFGSRAVISNCANNAAYGKLYTVKSAAQQRFPTGQTSP